MKELLDLLSDFRMARKESLIFRELGSCLSKKSNLKKKFRKYANRKRKTN